MRWPAFSRPSRFFDAVNFARRASAPALFSVGLMDPVSPPSTVFAVFNAYAGPKDIEVYPYNAHEGGGAHHVANAAPLAARWRLRRDERDPEVDHEATIHVDGLTCDVRGSIREQECHDTRDLLGLRETTLRDPVEDRRDIESSRLDPLAEDPGIDVAGSDGVHPDSP